VILVPAPIEAKQLIGAVRTATIDGERVVATPDKITIIVTPTTRHTSRYVVRLDGDERVLCKSITPFFDAARKLTNDGCDPSITLVMRHASSDTECLRAPLATAAALSVEETPYGPRLRRWKAIPTLAVAPRIARNEQAATTLAAPAVRRTRGKVQTASRSARILPGR
jgi:hypothetical protein